jgi:hypothetical protein
MMMGEPYSVMLKEDGSQLQVGFRLAPDLRLVDVRSKAKNSVTAGLCGVLHVPVGLNGT